MVKLLPSPFTERPAGAPAVIALMHKLDADYPGYGFSKHKGYPVREHLAALEQLGASPIHRRSFAPVRAVLGLPPLPPWPNAEAVSESIEKAEHP